MTSGFVLTSPQIGRLFEGFLFVLLHLDFVQYAINASFAAAWSFMAKR